ncbi:hypothetical protein [Methylobacterium sp. J-076]|uniref:hypothetical protein n=1 Tax=Methylobacterium sp. J-076 TaxID=2836655 RepID=UPI001FBA57B3|nr:hypothetical protein [Methylobacterium sp. J-076]MCJ2015646.1 hypothetical protein [Methylobacterium sp. J-076]
MRQAFSLFALGVVLATAPLAAQARPIHHAKVEASPSAKARRAALDGFAARMNRLDALMGSSPPARTRSASADQ